MREPRDTRVLIAEDEGMVARMTKAALESVGFSAIGIASDGRQAVEMVHQLKPDVVLMDIAMPEMDGIAAATLIQEECPTPVVILSAHEEPVMVSRASSAGVGAFVVKPAHANELERAIVIAVSRHTDLTKIQRLKCDLEVALANVRTIRGLLPICCSCKKIRDERDNWRDIEMFVMDRSEAKFSHGYCPVCIEKYFPGCSLP